MDEHPPEGESSPLRWPATRSTISSPPGTPSGPTSTWSRSGARRVSRLARRLAPGPACRLRRARTGAWEFDVLSALRRQGAPYQLTPGALLRATLVTSGTLTNRVDRLGRGRAGPPGARPSGPSRRPGHADPGRGRPGQRGLAADTCAASMRC